MCQKKVKFCCPVKYVIKHIFSQFTWLSQRNCGWWRKTTYTFEFSFKSSIRIRYFSSCAKKKVKFCCPVKYVNIRIFSQLTWLSQTDCGWWRKTTYTFEFSVKNSIRIRYFSSCAKKKKLNFVDQCNLWQRKQNFLFSQEPRSNQRTTEPAVD